MLIQPSARQIDAFFYGLFMDESILRNGGVVPANPRRAYVNDFALRIGQRATLMPHTGARAFGMLMALTHADLQSLYGAPGLEHYRPEAVLAHQLQGSGIPALCYNLPEAPHPGERNLEYALRLQGILESLGFPREYIDSIA
jgi:hypothetical protein